MPVVVLYLKIGPVVLILFVIRSAALDKECRMYCWASIPKKRRWQTYFGYQAGNNF